MRHNYRGWSLAFAGVLVGFISFAFAADFDPIEIDKAYVTPEKTAKTNRRNGDNLLKEILQGAKQVADAPVKAESDKYLQKYFMPSVVQPDRIREGESPRTALLKLFTSVQTTSAPGRQYLFDTTMSEMTKYARGNYEPQARVQAYLILGDLNTRERAAGDKSLPLPSSAALKLLLDDFDKPSQPDGIVSAILVGLVRHAHLNANDVTRPAEEKIQAADLDRLEKISLALIAEKSPPHGRSADGHDWLRRRAVEIAGHLAATRPSPKVVAALEALLADRKDSPEVRLAAANSMSQVTRRSAAGGPKLAIKPDAHGLALALADTLEQRFARIDKDREQVMSRRKVESLLKSRAVASAEGKFDKSDPFANHTEVMQRWLIGKIVAAWTGLTGSPDFSRAVRDDPKFGLYTGAPAAADKAALDEVKKQLIELQRKVTLMKIEGSLEDEVETIRAAAKDLAAIAAAPPPAGADAPAAAGDAAPADEPPAN